MNETNLNENETIEEVFTDNEKEVVSTEPTSANETSSEPTLIEQVMSENNDAPVITATSTYEHTNAQLDEDTIRSIVNKEIKKQKGGSHSIASLLLAAVVALGAGYGGGYVAGSRNSGVQVVETTTEETTTPQTTTVQTTQTVETTTTTTSSSDALTVKEVAAIASPSVVEINVTIETTISSGYGWGWGNSDNNTYTSTAAGSGVIISTDGYIITNHHVIEDATTITVTLNDGTSYEAELIGSDSKSDIGVIKINATGLTAATIGDSSTISAGDTAVVIGNPLGTLGGTVTDGIISATSRTVTINNESMELIQTNAAINSGNSGGGLFNDAGELIGIVNAKDSGTTSSGATIEGLGFAIPINTAIDVANQLIESGYVTDRATIGVMLQSVTQGYGNIQAGLYISEVLEGSGAEAAGLQAGDRIISIDGEDASTYQALSTYLKKMNVGDTVTMVVIREGEEMSFDVTLTGPIQTN